VCADSLAHVHVSDDPAVEFEQMRAAVFVEDELDVAKAADAEGFAQGFGVRRCFRGAHEAQHRRLALVRQGRYLAFPGESSQRLALPGRDRLRMVSAADE